MKKFFGLMLLVFTTFTAIAQEHLKFKGIPIDGKIETFIGKLQHIGYSSIRTEPSVALMKGEFGGNICNIMIGSSPTSHIVHSIIVFLNEDNSWHSLNATYNNYKNLLSSKYGKGDSFEFFSDPYYEGDGFETTAISVNKCTYVTFFDVPNGRLRLSIQKVITRACVVLVYLDNINYELSNKEENAAIIEDL